MTYCRPLAKYVIQHIDKGYMLGPWVLCMHCVFAISRQYYRRWFGRTTHR